MVPQAEKLMRGLLERAGRHDAARAVLYRKNDHLRANAKMNSYVLKAWCWQVLATARERSLKATYECGTVNMDFLRQLRG